MKPVTIYSKDYCPYCTLAKNLLTSLDIPYEEVDITEHPEVIIEIMQKSGLRTVPQIFVGESPIGGYDRLLQLHQEGKLSEVLK